MLWLSHLVLLHLSMFRKQKALGLQNSQEGSGLWIFNATPFSKCVLHEHWVLQYRSILNDLFKTIGEIWWNRQQWSSALLKIFWTAHTKVINSHKCWPKFLSLRQCSVYLNSVKIIDQSASLKYVCVICALRQHLNCRIIPMESEVRSK